VNASEKTGKTKMKQDTIWDYHQNKKPEGFEGSLNRISFLIKKIQNKEKALNIGVGSGIFEGIALAAGIEVFSLDPNAETIERLREKHRLSDKARAGDIQDIPFEGGFFDVVVVSEVLEHLSDEALRKALLEINRVLKPGGKILGTVPAGEDLDDQICVCPSCNNVFHRWGHQQSFTISKVKQLVGQYFKVVEIDERYFIPWNILNWKGKINGLIRTFLYILGFHGAGATIVFAGQK
jgi:ubiquinone/menaquinone biosynthesis C-methylase UbiE